MRYYKNQMKYWTNIWRNMRRGIFFIKGEFESHTEKQVLAAKKGDYFSPNNCYFDKVGNLPKGTWYIDGEKN